MAKSTPEERFWDKVDRTGITGCWLWTASLKPNGYGQVGIQGRTHYVHRLAYAWLKGPIPQGLTLDHLCRVRHCVNPDHLEPVTRGENVRRGTAGAWQQAKTHCPQGHEYAGANLYLTPQGHRECRACQRIASRRYYEKKRTP